MAEGGPKSALEIAMERLRQKDEAEGVVQPSLTEAQKAEIAEIRNYYEARLAEREVMHRSALARTFDPAARAEIEAEYRRDRERTVGEREAKIERVRQAARSNA